MSANCSGAVGLVQPDVSSAWVGTSVTAIEERLGVRVAWISRGSGALVPTGTTLIQEHDRLHLAVATERLTAVQRALSRPPVQEVRLLLILAILSLIFWFLYIRQ